MNKLFYNFSVSVCALAVLCFLSNEVKAAEKESVLAACETRYGKTFDAGLNLYEVSRFFALQVEFGKKGRLVKSSIVPKHFFDTEHPEWEEPADFEYLTWNEYKSFRSFLESLRPIGKLAEPEPTWAVVTNMTAPHVIQYEKAVLTRGDRVDVRDEDDAPAKVSYIYIEYKKYKPQTAREPGFSF